MPRSLQDLRAVVTLRIIDDYEADEVLGQLRFEPDNVIRSRYDELLARWRYAHRKASVPEEVRYKIKSKLGLVSSWDRKVFIHHDWSNPPKERAPRKAPRKHKATNPNKYPNSTAYYYVDFPIYDNNYIPCYPSTLKPMTMEEAWGGRIIPINGLSPLVKE